MVFQYPPRWWVLEGGDEVYQALSLERSLEGGILGGTSQYKLAWGVGRGPEELKEDPGVGSIGTSTPKRTPW